jgi:hypothetical protein
MNANERELDLFLFVCIRVYSRLLAFGLFAALTVFGAAVELTQRVIVLEPSDKELAVTESLILSNKGETAGAAVRVSIPDAARDTIQVTSVGPTNVPAQRTAEKAGRPNTYKIDFPVEPGETRVDVTYRLPFTSPGKFAARLLERAARNRLVAPTGVEIKGAGLELLGREPRSQAQIFEVKGDAIQVEIAGSGSMRSADAPAEDEESGPGIQRILPRLYDRIYLVVGLALAILALGFVLLYRRSP